MEEEVKIYVAIDWGSEDHAEAFFFTYDEEGRPVRFVDTFVIETRADQARAFRSRMEANDGDEPS